MSKYKVIEISYKGKTKGILCLGFDHQCPLSLGNEGCPCALIAIWNFLVLEREAPWEPDDGDGYISHKRISNHIVRECCQGMQRLKNTVMWEQINKQRMLILQLIKSLQDGFPLTPDTRNAELFVESDSILVLMCLGVRIVHGYVKPEHHVKQNASIFKLTKKRAELIKAVCADTAEAQLTEYGITCLYGCQEEGNVSILYANGHFSLLLKHEELLLTLQKSQDMLGCLPDAIWRKLTVVDGDTFYLTSRFSPTKRQQNISGADDWYDGKFKQKFGDLYDKQEAKDQKKRVMRKLETEGSNLSMGGSQPLPFLHMEEEGEEELPMVFKEQDAPPMFANQFLMFLSEFKYGSNLPYFEGILKAMEFLGTYKLCVPYELIMKYDERLALTIQKNYPRIHNDLKRVVILYLRNHGFQNVQESADVEIFDLPKPKSTQSVQEYVSGHEMTEEFELFGGVIQNSTTYAGRKMALGYLHYLLANFEAGFCWSEGFELDDMIVRNEQEFVINKEADASFTPDLASDNLLKYYAFISNFFMGKEGRGLPLYFDELHTDCLTVPDPKKEPLKWKCYLLLMRCPLALKAPSVRSAMICEIYILASAQVAFGPYTPLNNKHCLVEWRGVKMIKPFKWVYGHRNGNDLYVLDKWGCSYWFLLQYSRHFIEHVLNYLKKLIMLHDISTVELMLSRELGNFIASFIRYFVYNCDIDGVFNSAWAHFEASDCKDKPQKNKPKDAVNFQHEHDEPATETADGFEKLLYSVAAGSSVPCLKVLIQAGANPNMRTSGTTPLHVASCSGNIEVIKFLLEAGGDPNTCNDDGLKPIQVASLRDKSEVVKLLLPLTYPIPGVSNWTADGIKEFMQSEAVEEKAQVEDATRESEKFSTLGYTEITKASVIFNNALTR